RGERHQQEIEHPGSLSLRAGDPLTACVAQSTASHPTCRTTLTTPAPTRPPRPSATLVLVRDGAGGPEVLLVRRAERGDQNSNKWVFPGGVLDATDKHARNVCPGPDAAAASAPLGLACDGLEFYIAALRETFEEAGLLLAVDADERPIAGAC